MNEREKKILLNIVKEHIKTKSFISSKSLVKKYNLDISSATVRNIMAKLEQDGYIIQPYTSAGRIPSEKGYRVYLDVLAEQKWKNKLKNSEKNILDKFLSDIGEENFKEVAKIIADFSDNAVFWAFHRHNLYYTGISNLLKQPEFSSTALIYDISVIIDRMDEIVNSFFKEKDNNIKILIGHENPFGDFCGTVLVRYKIDNIEGLFGVLGPMRMDYRKNISLIKYTINRINYEQQRKKI